MRAAAELATVLTAAQAQGLPSANAAVETVNGDSWQESVGWASWEASRLAAPTTQYRIGSITKTFIAATVLQLVEIGELDLDDRVRDILPEVPVGAPTMRQLLSHTGGVAREVATGGWDDFRRSTTRDFLQALKGELQIRAPGASWNYSNLGYSILSEVIRRRTGTDPLEFIDQRLVRPLGLKNTSWWSSAASAVGYWVDPLDGRLYEEPVDETGKLDVSTQMWSSAADLARWGRALAGANPDVLSEYVTHNMRRLHSLLHPGDWRNGWGLGLHIRQGDGRLLAGHTGQMPGFLGRLSFDVEVGVVSVFLTNGGTGIDPVDISEVLLARVVGETGVPADTPVRHLSESCPESYRDALGQWWSEGLSFLFSWADGVLKTERVRGRCSRFREVGTDRFVCVSGPCEGEELNIERAGSTAVRISWAGFSYFRQPYQRKNGRTLLAIHSGPVGRAGEGRHG